MQSAVNSMQSAVNSMQSAVNSRRVETYFTINLIERSTLLRGCFW
jgi:hypothetical protein